MYQTDLVELATQVASILTNNKLIKNPKFTYEIYNELNRLGLKKTNKEDIFGLDEQINRIERVLILPLANIEAASSMELTPSSILLIGVPGTGKTHVIEGFLQQDTGVFIIPIDPKTLAAELLAGPQKKVILPRISKVFKQTGIPVILHLDDVENIANGDEAINSTLLNLMAGVRESGFFVIASTNYPEKLTPQLLQPQRFGHVIYFGLHQTEARRAIINRHAIQESLTLGRPLFKSEEERRAIIQVLTELTENFTPRYLADIPKEARSFLLERLAGVKNQRSGLGEEDISELTTVEDWEKAFQEVNRKYDKNEIIRRDGQLREFGQKYYRSMLGLPTPNISEQPSNQIRRRVEQLAAQLKQE